MCTETMNEAVGVCEAEKEVNVEEAVKVEKASEISGEELTEEKTYKDIAKDIKSRVQNKQSYTGAELKKLVTGYMELAGEQASEVIKEFNKKYILGDGCFPMADKIYYFLINKSGTMAPMRDMEKSPKKNYVKPLDIE